MHRTKAPAGLEWTPLRPILMSAALLTGVPGEARAHGEQVLVFPASTVLLLMATAVVLGAWGRQWRHKSLTLTTLLVVHAALWFVPLTIAELSDVLGWMFIALVAVPVGAALVVQLITRRLTRSDHGGARLFVRDNGNTH